jgi:predicted neutral ceramidase superfamily lipid hydrolase
MIFNLMIKPAVILVKRTNASVFKAFFSALLFYLVVNYSFAIMEIFYFGERFVHIFDYVFLALILAYLFLALYIIYTYKKKGGQ